MEINRLRSIIRESISNNLKEIEDVAENAAMEAKLNAYTEAIEKVNKKIEMAESLEEMQELVDPTKLNELKKHLKNLEKSKAKLEKVKTKKNKGKEVVTDEPVEEAVDNIEAGEFDIPYNAGTAEGDFKDEDHEAYFEVNESFLKMQKLAGVITEAQYNQKKSLTENQIEENYVLDAMGTVLVGGVGLVLATAGVVGGTALALDNIQYGPIGDTIKKLKNKISDRKFNKYIRPILLRFKNDQVLQDMFGKYNSASSFEFDAIRKEIADYIESKLSSKELKYIKDVVDSLHMSDLSKSFKQEDDMM